MPYNQTRRHAAPIAVAALSLAASLAAAQAAPPPIPPQADPPTRVGRVAQVAGAVSYHPPDADHWSPALLNFPVTSGDVFWTEPQAKAGIGISGNRLTMGGSTEFAVTTLDDHAFLATEQQGEVCLRLAHVPPGDSYAVQTARGQVQIAAAGRYEVTAGDETHPTTVTVVEGAAQITGPNLELKAGPHETISVTGTGALTGSIAPMQTDAFLAACLAEDRATPRVTATVPAEVGLMPGGEELARYGEWSDTPQYGAVWYPQVEAGWVPYRHGRWSYVAPWGWTWIDDAPWGFAPFHYGRWVERDTRWGWIPGLPGVAVTPLYRPVYAPALVAFIGIGVAAGFGPAGPVGSANVGWVPLGPGEPYVPPYRARPQYIANLNRSSVGNVDQVVTERAVRTVTINNNTVVQNFANRAAATAVPVSVMSGSQPIAAAAQPVTANQLDHWHTREGPMMRPSAATIGITPAVMRRFNVPAAAPALVAPGPALHPGALNHNAVDPGQAQPVAGNPPRQAGPNSALRPATPPPAAARPQARPAAEPQHPPLPRVLVPQRPAAPPRMAPAAWPPQPPPRQAAPPPPPAFRPPEPRPPAPRPPPPRQHER